VICIFHMNSQTTSTFIQSTIMPGIFVPVSSNFRRTPVSSHKPSSISRPSPPRPGDKTEPAHRRCTTSTSMAVEHPQPRNGTSTPTRLLPYSRIPQRRVVPRDSLNASKARKIFDATKRKSLTPTISSSSSVNTNLSTSYSSVSDPLTQASVRASTLFYLPILIATPEAEVNHTTIT